jgi:hypothetical protein
MGGEWRVGTEIGVANQPKVRSAAAAFAAYVPSLHNMLVLAQGVEP